MPRKKPAPSDAASETSSMTTTRRQSTELRSLRKQVRDLTDALIHSEDRNALLLEAVPAIQPAAPAKVTSTKAPSKTPVVAVGLWSDIHWGQKVQPDEVQNYGSYSCSIAERRLRAWTETFLRWVDVQRHAYPIDECRIVALGDLVHGLIHLDNLIYNERQPLPSAVEVGTCMAECVAMLAPRFRRVVVDSLAPDNHGRLTTKVLSQGRGEWSLGYVANEIARGMLRSHSNVTFTNHLELKMELEINGKLFLCEHGNDIRCWMGVPYYGIERLVQREYRRRANAGKPPFHYLLMGHFHVPAVLPNVVLNGALCGTTPYDHANARYAEPAQYAFLVHPKHGLFNYVPVALGGIK